MSVKKSKKRDAAASRHARPGGPSAGLLLAAFLAAAFVIYAPALNGTFISDDEHYVQRNVFVHHPIENWVAIWDPTSVLAEIVENYAPVHVLLHAVEWQLFGNRTFGYHAVNVALHALASLFLVLLLRRSGVSGTASALGGAFFLVHAANVEAVAWINQLKTSSAMVLCLGALLAHPRRAPLGAVLFGLALLAKPTAAVALFVAAAAGWARTGKQEPRSGRPSSDAGDVDWRWIWLGGWALFLALFAVAEFAAFLQTAGQAPALYDGFGDRTRSILAIALRYLVMAGSSYGLSTFHEPAPAGLLDPWWLASLPVLAALGWRTVVALRDRKEEAGWWLFAIVSFAPVCGIIPLPFPIADRYLYFILPGLIGGVLLAGPELIARLRPAASAGLWRGLRIAAAVLIVLLAVRSFDRASVWQTPFTAMGDSIANYPDGVAAKTHHATAAAQAGDAGTAVALLEAAHERGYNRLDHLLMPGYARIQGDAAFEALKREWAREWIERLTQKKRPSQHELQVVAQAQLVLNDLEAARATIVQAIEVGGPISENLRADLDEVERAIRFSRLREAR